MSDLQRLLRDADPMHGSGEDGLSPADAHRMRCEILAAVPDPPSLFAVWRRPLTATALATLILCLGGIAGDRIAARLSPPATPDAVLQEPSAPSSGEDRRQLQFSTPGGTRIIWVLDPNLRLQESLP